MFGILSSILNARAAQQQAELNRRHAIIHLYDSVPAGEPMPAKTKACIEALSCPIIVRETTVERSTGYGLGTVAIAFLLGGMMS